MEPDYEDAARLGPDALPHLEQLADGADVLMAAKAISLASLIGTARATQVLLKASRHPSPAIRVQAAFGVGHLDPDAAERLLPTLLDDADPGVRRTSLRSSRKVFPRGDLPVGIRQQIAALATEDPEPFVREAAALAR